MRALLTHLLSTTASCFDFPATSKEVTGGFGWLHRRPFLLLPYHCSQLSTQMSLAKVPEHPPAFISASLIEKFFLHLQDLSSSHYLYLLFSRPLSSFWDKLLSRTLFSAPKDFFPNYTNLHKYNMISLLTGDSVTCLFSSWWFCDVPLF